MGSDHRLEQSSSHLLELVNINLSIDNIGILKNIDLAMDDGTIHAIVGHHYAGKSSLGKIIVGALPPDSGRIVFDGKSYNSLSIEKANRLGIEMVYQQIHLFDYFTVAENLMIPDRISAAYPFINKKRLSRDAEAMIAKYNIRIDPHRLFRNLEFSEKMLIYILRSIFRSPRLLILDEALEKLESTAFESILSILMDLKARGTSIILITHKIDDIYTFADRVSIVKNGRILLTDEIGNIDRINLIKMTYTQITKEHDSENINREFHQLLKYNEAILQKLPLAIFVIDNENRIKMANKYGQSYFSMKNRKYLNAPFMGLFDEGNREPTEEIRSAIESNEEREFYNIPLHLEENDIIANIKLFPIYDGTFLIGKMIIIEDISRQEDLRQQVLLSEKLASVGLLAAGVAHEINNPLEIIYNHLNYLKFNPDRNATRDTLASIEEEITSIKQIVSNLISFSDSNKTVIEDFDINELVTSIINLLRFKIKHMNINISFHAEHPYIPFRANRNEIKQVMLNILKNSIEAMPEGGAIRIYTWSSRTKDGDSITISVSDTGPGIKDKNPTNVFLPFYSTKSRSGENLGLGLSISYGIVKKYNGDISVKNLKDSGCEFIITLPAK